jgi:hypothetical protein
MQEVLPFCHNRPHQNLVKRLTVAATKGNVGVVGGYPFSFFSSLLLKDLFKFILPYFQKLFYFTVSFPT